MKAEVPPLAPLPCFHPKSHPSSLQGSPRGQRRPASLRGDGNKAETSLHSFLLLTPCSFSIPAAPAQSHTHLSSAAFRASSSSSSSRPGRESSGSLGDALMGGGEHSSLSGSYNISHYVPVVKSNGFIIFYATNGMALKEAAAAFYHGGDVFLPKIEFTPACVADTVQWLRRRGAKHHQHPPGQLRAHLAAHLHHSALICCAGPQ